MKMTVKDAASRTDDANLISIFQCPDCEGEIHKSADDLLACRNCRRDYPMVDGIYSLLPLKSLKDTRTDNDANFAKWLTIYAEWMHDYIEHGNCVYNRIHHSAHKAAKSFIDTVDSSGWGLDLGCGAGAHFPYYTDPSRVIGMDINLDGLKLIKEKYPEAVLVHGDMYALPFKPVSLGYAVSVYNLEHAYFLECVIEQVLRALKPEGKFIVGLPGEGGLAWNLGRLLTSRRYASRTYDIDYKKIVEIEHCNTANRVLKALSKRFEISKKRIFPFPFIPTIHLNLSITVLCRKKHGRE